MAIPLLAGPSSIATVILFASQAPNNMSQWFIALAVASLLATLLLLLAVPLQKLLGVKIITALERLMGMILTTIAVQMFLTGLKTYLSGTS